MDLKQIESFVRVAELGSFTRAATALGVAQPLLSRHVRQLEVELRQTFLRRNGRGVVLTEAGQLLLEHGRGILHQVAVAREALGGVRGTLAGRVSIGLPPSLSKRVAVPLAQRFGQQLPEAQLTLTEGFSVLMLEALRSGRVDLAVLYNPPASPDIECELLRRESLVLLASRASLQALSEPLKSRVPLSALAELPLILPSRPNAFRLTLEAEMGMLGLAPRIALEVDGLNAIVDLVREGLGFAVLPPYTLSGLAQPHAFTAHAIQQPRLQSELVLVTSARRPSTETHKLARQLLADTIRGLVPA